MKSRSLLIIEDSQAIAAQLKEFFTRLGWEVICAVSGKRGLELSQTGSYDLVLLDLNLPDCDGVDICREIKRHSSVNIPVLMLTARDSFEDKAVGFGEGADDYVVKPFDFRELALRCEALTRRGDLYREAQIQVGSLIIDRQARTAYREGKSLALTRIGFELLLALAEAYPKALTRSQLHYKIWQGDPPDSDALRSHIYGLRNVLDKPFSRPLLKTIINVGYRLEP